MGDTPHLETALPAGALITGIALPPAPVAAHSRYRKVRERALVRVRDRLGRRRDDIRDSVVHDVRLASARWHPGRGGPAAPSGY